MGVGVQLRSRFDAHVGIDVRALRILHPDTALVHQAVIDPSPQLSCCTGELIVRVDAFAFDGRGDQRLHPVTGLDELADHVGEVVLALRVVVGQRGQRRTEEPRRECVHGRPDFANGALCIRCIALFHDSQHVAVCATQDPAVPGGVAGFAGEQRPGRSGAAVKLDEVFQRLVTDERHVAGNDEDDVVVLDLQPLETDSCGMPGAELLLLECRRCAWGQHGGHIFGLVPDNHDALVDPCLCDDLQHPIDERPPRGLVEHFREVGLHSGALPRTKEHRFHTHQLSSHRDSRPRGALLESGSPLAGWGDRTRTRTDGTKTRCAASYTTPQLGTTSSVDAADLDGFRIRYPVDDGAADAAGSMWHGRSRTRHRTPTRRPVGPGRIGSEPACGDRKRAVAPPTSVGAATRSQSKTTVLLP